MVTISDITRLAYYSKYLLIDEDIINALGYESALLFYLDNINSDEKDSFDAIVSDKNAKELLFLTIQLLDINEEIINNGINDNLKKKYEDLRFIYMRTKYRFEDTKTLKK
ncbi:MAG: hypothetical protein IJ572_02740 [Bacilli bacterium]|nr:hypothetical protein [Bacilli bacterium]